MNVASQLIRLARTILADEAEKEVERLLKALLPGTPFAGKVHAVGGYVRDEFMGLPAKDLDIVVELQGGSARLTKFIHDTFSKQVTTPHQMGANYPIWQITFRENVSFKGVEYRTQGAVIEFADTMTEKFPDPKSRQRTPEFATLEEDIERRDFTVNMLIKDMTSGEVLDLTGVSKDDIKKGLLRGHPRVSLDKIFSDDPLRMLRLIRFQCKYDWAIPLSVLKIVRRNSARIKIVSAERILSELKKIMEYRKLKQAVRLMKVTGLLPYILPEVNALRGVDQGKKWHQEGDVFVHTLLVLQRAPASIEGQMAALLHDIGKPQVREEIGEKVRFHGHEAVSAELARAVLHRMKFDKETIERVVMLVKNHMRLHQFNRADVGEKALRKLIREVGDDLIDTLVELSEADALGRIPSEVGHLPEIKERLKKIRTSPIKVTKKPVLNGEEVMALLGIKPGKKVREVLTFLFDLEDEYSSTGKPLTKEDAKREVLQKFSA